MKLRYDNPKATSRKRDVYLAYLDAGPAEAYRVASRVGIKFSSCTSWINEFRRRRNQPSKKKKGPKHYLDPSSTSRKRKMYEAYLKGGPLRAVEVGRKC